MTGFGAADLAIGVAFGVIGGTSGWHPAKSAAATLLTLAILHVLVSA